MRSGFIEHFSSIQDPRIERCKKHDLLDILFLTLSAVLSGCTGWEEIEDFGLSRLEWLRKYRHFANGIPSHDTLARVLSRLKPEQIQSCFISWVSSISKPVEGNIVAIDGKTARRSFTSSKDKNDALHRVSAWSCSHGLVLGQQKVDGKSNEIKAIPQLLSMLDIANTIVTLDAMGCQKAIAKEIVRQKADYVLALKGNQSGLQQEIEAFLHKANREKCEGVAYERVQHVDSGHGRIDVRRCLQTELDVGWLKQGEEWAGLKTVICVELESHCAEKVTTETRYYISSLAVHAEQALKAVRSHWQVESMHWMLDMTFREDDSRIRLGDAPEIFNIFRKLALNIAKNDNTRKASMRRKIKMAALDDDYRATLIQIVTQLSTSL